MAEAVVAAVTAHCEIVRSSARIDGHGNIVVADRNNIDAADARIDQGVAPDRRIAKVKKVYC